MTGAGRRRKNSWPRRLGGWLLCGLLLGCHSGDADPARFVPAPDLARQAVVAVLDSWRSGEPVRKVGVPPRSVLVADTHRRPEQSLESFRILGEAPLADGRRFVVRLQLSNPRQKERAQFLVIGVDPLWVFRQEDYDMIAHWDHPMTEPAPASAEGDSAEPSAADPSAGQPPATISPAAPNARETSDEE